MSIQPVQKMLTKSGRMCQAAVLVAKEIGATCKVLPRTCDATYFVVEYGRKKRQFAVSGCGEIATTEADLIRSVKVIVRRLVAEMATKTLHHNSGFFPNKVGRLDVLPRYPGVWG